MTQSYPLYDKLATGVIADSIVDLSSLAGSIRSIGKLPATDAAAHYEELAALVLHYFTLSNGTLPSNVPFGGEAMYGASGILYRLQNFPLPLSRILAQYIIQYSSVS
jgi:hypothetical protein